MSERNLAKILGSFQLEKGQAFSHFFFFSMDLLPNLSIPEALRRYAQQLESGAIPASSSIPLFPTTQTPASRTGSRTITNAIAPYSSLRGALGPDHDDTAAPLGKHPLPGLEGLDPLKT
ncbi:hypothetical protein C8J56DRAFT_1053883 [Mycena floridula]|nr:hypothetical protein C8J56DRAFT_1053883 [Mycena floridula]